MILFFFFISQQVFIVGVDVVQHGTWIVTGNAVFCHQSGHQRVGIFVKQAVMTYAKADGDV